MGLCLEIEFASGFTVPLQIQCSSCGHQGTVPDSYLGKEILCPKCQRLLVPLTPDKMESYAAKVLFAAPGLAARAEDRDVVEQQEPPTGAEVPFTCPSCGAAYQVSEELAGKKINCRNCQEPCRVHSPKPNKRPRRQESFRPFVWFAVLLSLLFIAIGFLLGRLSRL